MYKIFCTLLFTVETLYFWRSYKIVGKITLQDRAKLLYAQRLEEGQTKHLSCVQVHGSPSSPLLKMGWALKSKAKVVRFNEKQKSYLQSRFLHGEKLGKNGNGEAVAKDMRKARDAKNERLFSIEEFLTPQQSNSYFFSLCGQTKAAQ